MADKVGHSKIAPPTTKDGERKKPRSRTSREKKKDFLRNKDDDVVIEDDKPAGKKVGANKTIEETDQPSANDQDNRVKWCQQTLNKPLRKINREFIDNKKIKPSEYTIDFYEKNNARNRYNDIICIDQTRVVLKERGPDDNYIHASWMTMPEGNKYICTQGPTSDTVEDFWHMIFTEKSNVIIMLCSLSEGKHEKCARYYPKGKGQTEEFGPYKVSIKKIESDPFEDIKYQVLHVEKGDKSLAVHHLANHNWPDHIAPEKPAPTVGMYKMGRKLAGSAPITVHCSAGIGRTATFVGIDFASQKIRTDGDTSMVEVLREMRGQRFQAIQSPIQYGFMHICLLELFADESAIPRKGKFTSYLESYSSMIKRYATRVAAQQDKE